MAKYKVIISKDLLVVLYMLLYYGFYTFHNPNQVRKLKRMYKGGKKLFHLGFIVAKSPHLFYGRTWKNKVDILSCLFLHSYKASVVEECSDKRKIESVKLIREWNRFHYNCMPFQFHSKSKNTYQPYLSKIQGKSNIRRFIFIFYLCLSPRIIKNKIEIQ